MGAPILSVAHQSLFAAVVAAAEMRHAADPALLLPSETVNLARAAPKRVEEFTAGRLCARRALAEFGIVDFPVRVAADRQPIWPDTMVGSITHTEGLCVAVVAERRGVLSIGIDSEVVAPIDPRLAARICVPAESEWIASLPEPQRPAAITLIFSVKEAFFKCQYPIVGEWLGFKDLCIEPERWEHDETLSHVIVRPTRPLALAHRVPMPVHGRYRFHQRFVSSGIALEAPGCAQ